MNTGIQEACNLAWKLGLVHAGAGQPGSIAGFVRGRAIADCPRRPARHRSRDGAITLRNPLLESLRNRLASFLGEFDFVRQRIAIGISELGVNYRKSPIVAEDRTGVASLHGFAGPRAGDRVPDVPIDATANDGAARLFELLRGTRHHLLLFEGESPAPDSHAALVSLAQQVRNRLGRWIESRIAIAAVKRPESLAWDGPVALDVDRSLHHRFGATAACLYLIRPDGYVGYRSQTADAEKLWAYLERLFIPG